MRSAHTQRGGSDASVEHRGGVLIITEIVRGAEERDGRGKKRTNESRPTSHDDTPRHGLGRLQVEAYVM